jgi:hypothetical protein
MKMFRKNLYDSKRVKTFFDYDDSYPTCSRTHATLCIYLSDHSNANELTEKLGIQPSRTQVKGQVRNDRVRNWPIAWFLESKEIVASKEVRRHIDWLLEQLKDKSEVIKELQANGAEIHLSCFWGSAVGHGGPMLDPEILKKVASLNIGIAFDIYFEDDNESKDVDEPRVQ